jgi:hypothetical protein
MVETEDGVLSSVETRNLKFIAIDRFSVKSKKIGTLMGGERAFIYQAFHPRKARTQHPVGGTRLTANSLRCRSQHGRARKRDECDISMLWNQPYSFKLSIPRRAASSPVPRCLSSLAARGHDPEM